MSEMPTAALGDDSSTLRGAYVSLEDLLALRHRRRHALQPTARTTSVAGQRLARSRGRGVDFAEVRLYQPGDDVRTIDWRVTARKAKPHTKVFREERERPTLIVVDQTRSMFFGSTVRLKSVAAAEAAGRIAWHALNANDRVGGIVVGPGGTARFKPYRSSHAVARFLNAIVDANQSLSRNAPPVPPTFWDTLPNEIASVARVNQRIVLVSDFANVGAASMRELTKIGRHNDAEVLMVFDPLERALPPANQYAVTDGERRFQFDSGIAATRERYAARFDAHAAMIENSCHRAGIRFTAVSTADNLEAVVVER